MQGDTFVNNLKSLTWDTTPTDVNFKIHVGLGCNYYNIEPLSDVKSTI